ncbi:MAG: HDOD domain-containing protein [Deltaproteobacteria bacterium]|nr:HDOD domain-containing protein [Deltaproteobacteria bacterium]
MSPAVRPEDAQVEQTTRLAQALESLPTLPLVAFQITELANARTSSVQQIADVLKTDPSLSAKLLRLVNSAYFGIPGGVSEVVRAIPFVGFNTLYQLVLSISVFETLHTASGTVFDPRGLWIHSLTVANAARVLAEEVRFPEPGSCFTAGLLHDMGKIALAKVAPEKFAAACADARSLGISSTDAERKNGLPTHDQVGSKLAKLWRFQPSLAVPIELHHAIARQAVRDRLPANLRTATELIAIAEVVAKHCDQRATGIPAAIVEPDPMVALLKQLGIADSRLTAIYDRTMKQLELSKIFLSLLEPSVPASPPAPASPPPPSPASPP